MAISKNTKKILEFCAQACINTYQGDHGKVDYRIYKEHKSFDTGNVEFDIGLWNDFLVIAFEGSDGKGDWRDNLDFKKVKPKSIDLGSKALVHEGFERQFQEAWPIILKELLEKKYIGFRKILVTGHSLGGALATRTSVQLAKHFEGALVYCVSLGAPRVGNHAFAKGFAKHVFKSYRIVNDMDSVCKVPPAWFGFWHVDKEIEIGSMSWYEYPLHPVLWWTGNPLDHYPEKYQSGIKRLKTK